MTVSTIYTVNKTIPTELLGYIGTIIRLIGTSDDIISINDNLNELTVVVDNMDSANRYDSDIDKIFDDVRKNQIAYIKKLNEVDRLINEFVNDDYFNYENLKTLLHSPDTVLSFDVRELLKKLVS